MDAKTLAIVLIALMALSPVAAVDMGNKYLIDTFNITNTSFNATLTNQNNGATGDGFYEIAASPAANHKDVLQNGTFLGFLGTQNLTNIPLAFKPVNGTVYWLLVYTDYPEHDNRVSKEKATYIDPFDPGNNETNETETNETDKNETFKPVDPVDPGSNERTIPMKNTGTDLNTIIGLCLVLIILWVLLRFIIYE